MCRRLADDPDDAFQEVWAKVFAALGSFRADGPASIRTWIRSVAQRHLVDLHRRGKVRGAVLSYEDRAADVASVEQRIATRQTVASLTRALDRLPAEQRRVVVGHHLGGLTLVELADAESVAIGTVKSRLHRGRARLAEILASARPQEGT